MTNERARLAMLSGLLFAGMSGAPKAENYQKEREKGQDRKKRKRRIKNRIARHSRRVNRFRARGPKHKKKRKVA